MALGETMNEQERFFLEKLAAASGYPDSLFYQDERRAARKARAEHYAERKHQVFDEDLGRRKGNPLIIIDFGTGGSASPAEAAGDIEIDEVSSEERSGKKANLHIIRNIEKLRNKLCWPDPKQGTWEPGYLKKDPPLRVIAHVAYLAAAKPQRRRAAGDPNLPPDSGSLPDLRHQRWRLLELRQQHELRGLQRLYEDPLGPWSTAAHQLGGAGSQW
ncbi:uncharacterized protein BDZ83DRAFT_773779 [Colletotrichum acutatum]|uniref:Uncharacterized protein n=1 Tax=Glomerella acutata TaxID=27357 RepID=A0AAD8ULW8_GLOAC|nr:uncharacterized protein BDZ83DRAFT_773779 [Colletotrichum acutatum]KAK1726707.1 hypothetical protein BDZ83DRAFT_773779 [Colletotrichum acutatum]